MNIKVRKGGMSSISQKLSDVYGTSRTFFETHMTPLTKNVQPDDDGFSVESYDPERVRFYLQMFSDIPGFANVMDAYNNSSVVRETWNTNIRKINKNLGYINSLSNEDEKTKALESIKKLLQANPLTKDLGIKTETLAKETETKITGGARVEPDSYYFKNIGDLGIKGEAGDKRQKNYTNFLGDNYAKYNDSEKWKGIIGDNTKPIRGTDNIAQEVENHPYLSPNMKKTTRTDILVFIAVTFVLRSISLFVVDWAINTHMVVSKEDAIFTYIGTYILLFCVLALLVNTGNSSEDESMINPFKLLLYYINIETQGSTRIVVHMLLQLVLVPIIFVVKDKRAAYTNTVVFDDKQAKDIYRVLANVSLFIWAASSVLAMRI